MKSKILIFFIGITFFSCSDDLLEVPPNDALSSSQFFKTQEDFEQAINGVYAPLRNLYNEVEEGAWVMGEMRSDNSHYKYNPDFRAVQNAEGVTDFLPNAANVVPETKYVNNYLIIARANQVLDIIDEVDFDQSVKDNIKGQAMFLRALSYFDLVQYFGEVPLHLKPVTSREDAALPLSSVEKIYEQIFSDAMAAINLLPSKSIQEPGRATSGAAKMLLGNAYVVRKNWSKAVIVLSDLIESAEYSLLSDYASAFNINNKNSSESIFEVQFLEGSEGFASRFIYDWLPKPLTADQVASITGVASSQAATREGFNIPTPDLIESYEDGDVREDISIGYVNVGGRDYPYIKKLIQPHATPELTGTNWPVYRYSEALLLYAEALNEDGNSGLAEDYLNQVRTRANLGSLNGLSQSALRDAILQERRVELAFENKRWLDLVRTGRAQTVMKAYGQRVKADPELYYYPSGIVPPPSAYTVIEEVFPLPASEALLSPFF